MKITQHCQQLLLAYLKTAKVAVDATIGNGNDTLYLANNLPKDSTLIGFDVQEMAITNTHQKLHSSNHQNYQLYQVGHERLKETLSLLQIDSIDLIMFNLGYLPRGDKSITTQIKTTISALGQSLELLSLSGIISVLVYPGHPEGKKESFEIDLWIQNLPSDFEILKLQKFPANQINPYLYLINRRH